MDYVYFYQNIAEWLLHSMLIFIDSSLQILILDNFPIGNRKYEYLPHGNMMVNISTACGSNLMV